MSRRERDVPELAIPVLEPDQQRTLRQTDELLQVEDHVVLASTGVFEHVAVAEASRQRKRDLHGSGDPAGDAEGKLRLAGREGEPGFPQVRPQAGPVARQCSPGPEVVVIRQRLGKGLRRLRARGGPSLDVGPSVPGAAAASGDDLASVGSGRGTRSAIVSAKAPACTSCPRARGEDIIPAATSSPSSERKPAARRPSRQAFREDTPYSPLPSTRSGEPFHARARGTSAGTSHRPQKVFPESATTGERSHRPDPVARPPVFAPGTRLSSRP